LAYPCLSGEALQFAGAGIFLQNRIGFGGPIEGFGFGVAVSDPGFDGSHEVVDALEHAAADLSPSAREMIGTKDVGLRRTGALPTWKKALFRSLRPKAP
jgi:hypothetical protein